MFLHNTRLVLTVSWTALVLLAFWSTGASSGFSLILLAVAAILPPIVMLALWNDGPPQTIAEVIHDAEGKR